MTLRLIFRRDSIRDPASRHRDNFIEGETYTELIERWNEGPWFWDRSPEDFRERLADMSGGRVEWPGASDEELILGVVEEANASKFSDGIRLEGAPRASP